MTLWCWFLRKRTVFLARLLGAAVLAHETISDLGNEESKDPHNGGFLKEVLLAYLIWADLISFESF